MRARRRAAAGFEAAAAAAAGGSGGGGGGGSQQNLFLLARAESKPIDTFFTTLCIKGAALAPRTPQRLLLSLSTTTKATLSAARKAHCTQTC
jgi:hypothetical protein